MVKEKVAAAAAYETTERKSTDAEAAALTVTMEARPPSGGDIPVFVGEAISPELARRLEEAIPVHNWERYDLVRVLGRGGMGVVYEARDKRLDRFAALKFIHNADPHTT